MLSTIFEHKSLFANFFEHKSTSKETGVSFQLFLNTNLQVQALVYAFKFQLV